MQKWFVNLNDLHDYSPDCRSHCESVVILADAEEAIALRVQREQEHSELSDKVWRATVEEARREGCRTWAKSAQVEEEARADERAQIVRELTAMADRYKPAGQYDHESHIIGNCIAVVERRMSRPAQKPKPLDKTIPIIYAMETVREIFQKAIEEVRNGKE